MVDSRRDATDSRAAVVDGRIVRSSPGFAVSDSRADAGVADSVLLGGDPAAAVGVIGGE